MKLNSNEKAYPFITFTLSRKASSFFTIKYVSHCGFVYVLEQIEEDPPTPTLLRNVIRNRSGFCQMLILY